jgi:hypothetical protein
LLPLMTEAQPKKLPSPEERIAALDKNGDKKLTKEEYVAPFTDDAKKQKAKARFDNLDNDKDGLLSLYEFKAGLELQQKN